MRTRVLTFLEAKTRISYHSVCDGISEYSVSARAWRSFASAFSTLGLAQHRSSVGYNKMRVWSAAVRLLRVDYRCQITDQDREAGYILFEYPSRGKLYAGSVELMEEDAQRTGIAFSIPKQPSYIESMMLDKLKRKLVDDYGEPVRPAPKKKPKQKVDGDSEDDAEKDARRPSQEEN